MSIFVKKLKEKQEATASDIMEVLHDLVDDEEVVRFCEEYLRAFGLII